MNVLSNRGSLAAQARAADALDHSALYARIQNIVSATPLIMLSTVSAHGWPMTHCMHFSFRMEQQQPLIYMFTNEGTRKLTNIQANPAVSLSILSSDPAGLERLVLRMQGLCREVTTPTEHAFGIAQHASRPGYEHVRYLTPQHQPLLRVDVTSATLTDGDAPVDVAFAPNTDSYI